MFNFCDCGCLHSLHLKTGYIFSLNKCKFHTVNSPKDLGSEYSIYSSILNQEGEIMPSPHMDELESQLGELPDGSGKSALEVGGGISPYVTKLLALGYRYIGVEPSEWAAQWMRNRFKVTMIAELLGDLITGEKFDLVLAAHCLEHMPDPLKSLAKMASLLKPQGKLYIVVPEGTDLYNPDHLVFFTQDSLTRCAEEVGLRVLKSTVHRYVEHERFIYMLAELNI